MIDLRDVTFNIPIRYDTEDRKENLNTIIHYLASNFQTNIIVCEESNGKVFDYISTIKNVQYIHVHSDKEYFHRTKCLNKMAKMSNTPIIVNYDCDVLFKREQLISAINVIRNNNADIIFPYAGIFYEMPRKYISILRDNDYNFDHVLLKDCNINHPNSVGGCIIWNKNKFIQIGMENENFMSWGWEDTERVIRAQKLGLILKRTDGYLFHITHRRLKNSKPNEFTQLNQLEYNKINSMSKDQLQEYIKTWKWINV